MHRQQLDGGDAQRGQVPDRGRMSETGIRAAQFLGDVRCRLVKPLTCIS